MDVSQLMFRDGLLKDERILVTGGGSGLGKEMAEGFLKLGAEVHICGRRGQVCEDTAKELMAEFVGMDDEMNFDQFAGMLRVLDTRMLFKQYDADDSGLVDVAELTEMLVACGHNSDEGMASALVIEFGGEGAEGLNQEQFGNLLASIDRKSSPDGLSHERGVVVAVEVKGAGAETAEETSTASSASAGARRSGSTAEGSETCFAPFFFCSCMGQSDDTADDDSYLHPESQAAT